MTTTGTFGGRRCWSWVLPTVFSLIHAGCGASDLTVFNSSAETTSPDIALPRGAEIHSLTVAPRTPILTQPLDPDFGFNNQITPVVLTGANFTNTTRVKMQTGSTWQTLATTFDSATRLRLEMPRSAGKVGPVRLRLENPSGTSTPGPSSEEPNAFYYGSATPSFAETPMTSGYPLSDFVVGDINNDGNSDLAIIHRTDPAVTIAFGNGRGSFISPEIFDVTSVGSTAGSLSDIDQDGNLDLVLALHDPHALAVYKGDGAGNFNLLASYPMTAVISAIAAGDLDNDLDTDIIVSFPGTGDIGVLLNDGTGTLASPTSHPVGRAPAALLAKDLDGDGKLDVVVANSGSNDVSVLLGDGAGGFLSSTSVSTDAGPVAVVAADVDQDGFVDLAVAAASGRAVTLLTGDGLGGFSKQTVMLGRSPTSLEVADINGDRSQDIVVSSRATDSVGFLLRTNSGSYAPTLWKATGRAPGRLAITAVDNNNLADIVIVSEGIARLQILRNQSK